MKKSQLRPGDVFLVPMESDSPAVGVVVRTNAKGIVFGHFFLQRFAVEVVPAGGFDLGKEQPVLTAKFGDKFLVEGKWPVVGRVTGWRDENFPLPRFSRADAAGAFGFITEYDEHSFECLSEIRVPIDELEQADLVPDRLLGAAVVEASLVKLSRGGSVN